jgi:hypothetical protein
MVMERQMEHKRHSGSFWAYVLIIFGVLWIMKKSGWDIHFPGIGEFFSGLGHFFGTLTHWSFGAAVPVLIILFGLALIIGRRFFGALLFVILLLIFIPHFLIIPGILTVLFFPIILIVIGIIILTRLF